MVSGQAGGPFGDDPVAAASLPEPPSRPHHDPAASGSPDALVAALIRSHVPSGLIVGLGTRSRALASLLGKAGYDYVDLDFDLGAAGPPLAPLGERLARLPQVRAICLLDVLQYRPDPEQLIRLLAAYALDHGAPALVVSAPNVGHQDLALGLLAGHWLPDVAAPSGVRPLRFFTRAALAAILEEPGWRLVDRRDSEGDHAEQHDPDALLDAPTLAGSFVRQLSLTLNADARVRRFVWLLRPEPVGARSPGAATTTAGGAPPRPAVSILMRTQGRRPEQLAEALTSIYAQTSDDYEVVLCFHNLDDVDGRLLGKVRDLVGRLPTPFRDRVRVIASHGLGRGAPLNDLLAAARGIYASFLDDDDLLFDHHVETLARAIGQHGASTLFQTYAAQRLIEPVSTGHAGAYTATAMSVPWTHAFDPVQQHFHNLVPICCLALPIQLIRQVGLRFRADLEVGEDWELWMSASELLDVTVLPSVTAVVNLWNDRTTNAMRRPDLAPLWHRVRDARHAERAPIPLLLPGRARASLCSYGHQPEQLAQLRTELAELGGRLARTEAAEAAARRRAEQAASEVMARRRAEQAASEELAQLRAERAELGGRLARIEVSRVWRVGKLIWATRRWVREVIRCLAGRSARWSRSRS